MKHVAFAILGVVVAFLMFAFYNLGFDISLWSADSRALCLISMCAGAVVGVLASTFP